MNRTLVVLLGLSLLLSACQPAPPPTPPLPAGEGGGEGVAPTPPPTQTPIPTLTPHPAFVDLQSRLADLGLTLLPDGTIETTADGGRRTVPNLLVSPEGIISLTLKDGTVVTVTPEDMSVDEAGGLKIKGYEWDSEQGGWVAKTTYTLEQLQAMSAQEKIALAPSWDEIDLPQGYEPMGKPVLLGEIAVAYYAKGPNGAKQMIAAHNLLNPEGKYSGVSVYEWAMGKYAVPVFVVNDPSLEGTRIPPHYVIPGQEAFLSKVMHGNFALGSATGLGEFNPLDFWRGSKESTVDGQLRLFDKILAKYEQRLKEGTVFADGGKITLGGPTPPIFLREGLPVYVEYVVKFDETKGPAVYEGRLYVPVDTYDNWIITEFKDGVLRMTILMNEEVYRIITKEYVCEMGGFARLFSPRVSGGGSQDASKMPIMWALGIRPPWNPGIESKKPGGKNYGTIDQFRFPFVFDDGAGYDCGIAPLK